MKHVRIGEALASGVQPEDWRGQWEAAWMTARIMRRFPPAVDPGYSRGWLYKFAWDIVNARGARDA